MDIIKNKATFTCAVITIIIASLVLTGWILDIDGFKRLASGYVSMKPNAAIAFILLSISLILLQMHSDKKAIKIAIKIPAVIVFFLAIASLMQTIFNLDLGIDQYFFKDTRTVNPGEIPGRMVILAAINFSLLSLIFIFSRYALRQLIALTHSILLFVITISMLALIGYIYKLQALPTRSIFTSMSVYAAIAFIVFCIGLFAQTKDRGIAYLVSSPLSGGVLARSMLPIVILLPVMTGWVYLKILEMHLLVAPLRVALIVVVNIILLAYIIILISMRINKMDLVQKEIEDEKDKIQNSLIESEKMAIIGYMSSGVAHEINNPLGFVMSNVLVLNKRLQIITDLINMFEKYLDNLDNADLNDKQNKMMQNQIKSYITDNKIFFILEDTTALTKESLEGITRIKNIVANLNSFGGDARPKYTEVNINNCIALAIDFISDKLRNNIEIIKEFQYIPSFTGSYEQLQLVFIYLLQYAIDELEEKGRITISTTFQDEKIIIKFKDTREAMPPHKISTIFTASSDNESKSQNAGINLSNSYRIIESHGGNIKIDSRMDEGTCFIITLPIKRKF